MFDWIAKYFARQREARRFKAIRHRAQHPSIMQQIEEIGRLRVHLESTRTPRTHASTRDDPQREGARAKGSREEEYPVFISTIPGVLPLIRMGGHDTRDDDAPSHQQSDAHESHSSGNDSGASDDD
jgi:hypothetical protein